MSCDEWNTFIQVNIYGQTLQALKQRGVVLETVLNDLGCSKLWITEGKLYNEHATTIDSEDTSTIVVPVFSTTTVEEKCPRFSTPAVSQNELQRKFTLNLPIKLSEINSSFEEDGFSMEMDDREENDGVIVELLKELVEKASEEFEEIPVAPEFNPSNDYTERPLLSTTIVKRGPRYSTPIASEVDLSEVFALDMPEIFSDIESNDDDGIESEVQFQRKTLRSISTVPSVKRRQSRRLSAPDLKGVDRKNGEKPRLQRLCLTRSTTERECSQLKIPKFCSMNPEIYRTETNAAQLLARIDSIHNGSQVKGDAAVRTFEVPEPHDEPHDDLSMPHYHEMENIVYDQSFNQYDFDEEGGDYHSIPEESEETLQIDMYTPPPLPNTIKTKSIMKSVDGPTMGNKKAVSFKTPPKNRDNTLHIIQCCFKGCKKGLQWRRKYGKIHLANHALSHLKEKCIKCKNCDFRANSVTQIRYHYKTKHSDVKMEGFGMICDEWNKFIQVNIYGHTLQGLEEQGVVLEALLNDVGCSKLWIVEGSMYKGESFDQSTIESATDVTVPVLSTTIADVKCPRFSTPAVSQNELQRQFTLNLPVKYSEINSSFEEDGFLIDEQPENDENDDVIVQLLSELVEKASDELESPANPNELIEKVVDGDVTRSKVLSTTYADVPRYSTPISSEIDQDEVFTLNMPEILSDIESNDDDAIVTSEDRKRKYGRSVSAVKPSTRRSRRLSAPNLKSKLKGKADEEEPKMKRPA
ncbi:Protein CBG12897 [Caenorhabditis briggsae]|uniref:Protein CBG12897 n=1 Tax=Caenorhabditis briggsae TaxID=6238 RepID=A8XGM0_CAEBR|nr:Protein CBG12897 [Caenorhabditis briggsae]CAP31794.1 Protein CBG12897 [Caenorhabditis briggsae]